MAADATLLDEDGIRFADSNAAMAHARDLMTELVRSPQTQDGAIVVENEDDGELFEVPRSNLLS
ncbi:hypothetical protein [Tardiphaga sp.]|uniref:DUF6894 family protein n=1 Tax=Tardiphaga sp. TaxID=1926292 RepID=UPI002627BBE7|nr:hypothetical protein [Tardiphaga sp.]